MERRENLQVVDVSDKITTDDVVAIKQIVRIWHFGKIIVFLILGLGAVATAGLALSNSIIKLFDR